MTEEREMTALDAPVGAGAEQPSELTPIIIPDYGEDFTPSAEEMFEAQVQYEQEMQAQAKAEREASPGFMQTVSMPELYEMVYPGKPPIIDHFLYPGTYLFVGAPKVGKSFMMPFDDEVAIVCNEEGKMRKLPPNQCQQLKRNWHLPRKKIK